MSKEPIKKTNFDIGLTEIEDFTDMSKDLVDLLTDRISDLHHSKADGLQQARHAFIFYRKLLNELTAKIKDNLK
jgi:hypothetical protein